MEEEIIRRYFNDELSSSELADFENRRATDTEFAKEVETFESTRNAIKLSEKTRLKAQLKAIEKKRASKRLFPRLAVAATILLLITAGGLIWWNQGTQNASELFAEHYAPYPNVYAPITRDIDSLTSLEKAFTEYELGNYTQAEELLQQELKNEENGDIQFYLAVTHIELENYELAEQELSAINASDTRYYPQVLWYRALIQLKKNKTEKAKALLSELDQMNSGYKTDTVKSLLKALEE